MARLAQILDEVSSLKIKTRNDAIEELRAFIVYSRNRKDLKEQDCSVIQRILKRLFEVEREINYQNTKRQVSIASINDRFQKLGSLFRLYVESFILVFTESQIPKLLNLIQRFTYSPKGTICDPVCLDFGKSLHLLFSHSPHVQHLQFIDWQNMVLYCSKAVEDLSFVDESYVSDSEEEMLASQSSKSDKSIWRSHDTIRIKQEIVEYITVIKLLMDWFAAPIHLVQNELLCFLRNFFRTFNEETNAHLPALNCLYRMCVYIVTNDRSAVLQVTELIFQILEISQKWKRSTLRSLLLQCLAASFPIWSNCTIWQLSSSQSFFSFDLLESSFDILNSMLQVYGDVSHFNLSMFMFDATQRKRNFASLFHPDFFLPYEVSDKSHLDLYFIYLFMAQVVCLMEHCINMRSISNFPKKRRNNISFSSLLISINSPDVQESSFSVQILSIIVSISSMLSPEKVRDLTKNSLVIAEEKSVSNCWYYFLLSNVCYNKAYSIVLSEPVLKSILALSIRGLLYSETSSVCYHILSYFHIFQPLSFPKLFPYLNQVMSMSENHALDISHEALQYWKTLYFLLQGYNSVKKVRFFHYFHRWIFQHLSKSYINPDINNFMYSTSFFDELINIIIFLYFKKVSPLSIRSCNELTHGHSLTFLKNAWTYLKCQELNFRGSQSNEHVNPNMQNEWNNVEELQKLVEILENNLRMILAGLNDKYSTKDIQSLEGKLKLLVSLFFLHVTLKYMMNAFHQSEPYTSCAHFENDVFTVIHNYTKDFETSEEPIALILARALQLTVIVSDKLLCLGDKVVELISSSSLSSLLVFILKKCSIFQSSDAQPLDIADEDFQDDISMYRPETLVRSATSINDIEDSQRQKTIDSIVYIQHNLDRMAHYNENGLRNIIYLCDSRNFCYLSSSFYQYFYNVACVSESIVLNSLQIFAQKILMDYSFERDECYLLQFLSIFRCLLNSQVPFGPSLRKLILKITKFIRKVMLENGYSSSTGRIILYGFLLDFSEEIYEISSVHDLKTTFKQFILDPEPIVIFQLSPNISRLIFNAKRESLKEVMEEFESLVVPNHESRRFVLTRFIVFLVYTLNFNRPQLLLQLLKFSNSKEGSNVLNYLLTATEDYRFGLRNLFKTYRFELFRVFVNNDLQFTKNDFFEFPFHSLYPNGLTFMKDNIEPMSLVLLLTGNQRLAQLLCSRISVSSTIIQERLASRLNVAKILSNIEVSNENLLRPLNTRCKLDFPNLVDSIIFSLSFIKDYNEIGANLKKISPSVFVVYEQLFIFEEECLDFDLTNYFGFQSMGVIYYLNYISSMVESSTFVYSLMCIVIRTIGLRVYWEPDSNLLKHCIYQLCLFLSFFDRFVKPNYVIMVIVSLAKELIQISSLAFLGIGIIRYYLKRFQIESTFDSVYLVNVCTEILGSCHNSTYLTKDTLSYFYGWFSGFSNNLSPSLDVENGFGFLRCYANFVQALPVDWNNWTPILESLFLGKRILPVLLKESNTSLYFWQSLCSCPLNAFGKALPEICKYHELCDISKFPDYLKTYYSNMMGSSFLSLTDETNESTMNDEYNIDYESTTYSSMRKNVFKRILREVGLLLFSYNFFYGSFIESSIRLFLHEDVDHEYESCLPFGNSSILYEEKGMIDIRKPSNDSSLFNSENDQLFLWVDTAVAELLAQLDKTNEVRALSLLNTEIKGVSLHFFHYIVHIVLLDHEFHGRNKTAFNYINSLIFEGIEQAREKSVRELCMKVLLYLRKQPKVHESTPFARNFWLKTDYLVASEAAYQSGLCEQSLLFLNLHQTDTLEFNKSHLSNVLTGLDWLDVYYGIHRESNFRNMLMKAVHEKKSFSAISYLDAMNFISSQSIPDTKMTMSNTLLNGGFYSLNESYVDCLKSQNSIDECNNEIYASAWRMQKWDLPPVGDETEFDGRVYGLLQSAYDSDSNELELRVNDFICRFMRVNCHSREKETLLFHSLISEFTSFLFKEGWNMNEDLHDRLINEKMLILERYDYIEPLLSFQDVAFTLLENRAEHLNQSNLKEIRKKHILALLKNGEVYLLTGKLQLALSTAMSSDSLYSLHLVKDTNIRQKIDFLTSRILWQKNETSDAICLLKQSLDSTECSASVSSLCYAYLGKWLFSTKSEKTEFILENCFEKAISYVSDLDDTTCSKIHYMFASFCDANYSSPELNEEFRRAERLYLEKKDDILQLEDSLKLCKQEKEKRILKHHYLREMAALLSDQREYQTLCASKDMMLKKGIIHYLKSLLKSDENDVTISRFCIMWLSNSSSETLNVEIEDHILETPRKKFIPVYYQLAARLLNDGSKFQKLLGRICLDVAQLHPYHSLHVLYSLISSPSEAETRNGESRFAAVQNIMKTLQTFGESKSLIDKLLKVFMNYVTLAEWNPRSKTASTSFSRSPCAAWFLNDFPQLDLAPITSHLAINDMANYSDVPTVVSFSNTIGFASGINVPKIVKCTSSDGRIHKQLVKGGNDDLRQDAVMEQVFEQVNGFLKNYRSTMQRKLTMRTYKVIPLALKTGVIEWVLNTVPMAEYLDPAHKRYYPKDWSLNVCRKLIVEKQMEDTGTRLKVFDLVCRHYHPVFRHFFFEKYPDPMIWFRNQTNYSRSTAVASVLGYVLGLGDRHANNILVDVTSGQVVHIDLGITFEQGKKLPVPECVPFRLTRDVVDGMGITGVEGVFRRSMEFTLETLRHEVESLVSILEVLRYDPLFSWLISPIRRMRKQKLQIVSSENEEDMEETTSSIYKDPKRKRITQSVESEAERALLVVKKKLSNTLSIEASVGELIRIARDPSQLSLMFCGWSAFQ
ncbi:ATM checkpoint kinase [Schizosaccharomyces cryophilus OY26]|uniref:Serine/threonine-protein kinase Tel1 n=1 Tax=Schizosaccharomyces cryophilus (strain OY26 / ATCC MYA-4695 / CBS 11777 / NBRC 106824 / NRRL Y48691) TaxID=653667 RepID=S9VWJ4_SCHCR|nr:ATM checkpoint kinase [Schizosaccharomyces cryophilus OY26]EPY50624.1 ATM checkpoint kinase [Schizosaccharomyces cryophilus OY26]